MSQSDRPNRIRVRLLGFAAIAAIAAGAILLLGPRLRPRPGGPAAPASTTPPAPVPSMRGDHAPPGSAPRPVDPKAYAEAAEAERKANDLIGEGREEEAIPGLREALALHEKAGTPANSTSQIALNLGAALFRTGRAAEAAEAMRRWVERAPDDGEAWQLLAKIQFQRGLRMEADRAIARARALLPPSIVLLRMALRIQTELSRRDEALKLAREAIALDADEETTVAALEAYIRFRAFEEARPLIDRLRASKPDDPMVRYAGGIVSQGAGRDEEAERDLRLIIDDPAYAEEARLELAALLVAKGRPAEAIPIAGDLLERNPYVARAYYHLSIAYARAGETKLAESVKNLYDGLAKSEDAFQDAREFASAGKALEAAISEAHAHKLRGEFRKAETILREAAESLGEPREIALELADLYGQAGRFADLEAVCRRIGGPSPRGAIGFHLGRALRRMGKIREALPILEAAAEQDESGEATVELADMLLEDMKDLDAAGRWFERALGGPADRYATLGLARVAFERGRRDEVEARLAPFSDGEGAATARLWRARAAARAGDAARARELFQGITDEGFLARLARAEIGRAGGDAASAETERKLLADQDRYRDLSRQAAAAGWPEAAPILVSLARMARDLGELRDAGMYARLAVQADPDLAGAQRILAELPGQPFLRLASAARARSLDPKDAEADRLRRGLRARWKLDG